MKDTVELKVGDVMTKGVICIDIGDTVQEAAEIMGKNDISSLLVTDKGDGVGVVTERDIIKKVVAKSREPGKIAVQDIMSSPLLTLNPDSSIEEAARLMRDKDIRRVFVTSRDKIVGILSESDIVGIEPALHTLIQEHAVWELSKQHAAEEGLIAGECESCENYSESLRTIDGRLLCRNCAPAE
ncbi:MAG TPA: CBS domain-containing protein [Candidatus Altiarchaeales archaeon]|nr:CBS domain-containing protein [Candidatus Altiarchaeales archaeon]